MAKIYDTKNKVKIKGGVDNLVADMEARLGDYSRLDMKSRAFWLANDATFIEAKRVVDTYAKFS